MAPDPALDPATRDFVALPPEARDKVLWHEQRAQRAMKEHDHALLRRGMIFLALLSAALLVVISVMWVFLSSRTDRSREVDQQFHDTACAVLSLAKGHHVPHREQLFMHEMHRACPQGPRFFDRPAGPTNSSRANASGRGPGSPPGHSEPSQGRSASQVHRVTTGKPGHAKGPGTGHQPNPRPSAAPTPTPGRPRPTPTQTPHSPPVSPSPSSSPALPLPSLPLVSPLVSAVSSLLP